MSSPLFTPANQPRRCKSGTNKMGTRKYEPGQTKARLSYQINFIFLYGFAGVDSMGLLRYI